METRNLFIDTCIFIQKKYNFRNYDLQQIGRLSKAERARVFITDITIREVEANIETDVLDAIRELETFQRKAGVLRNIDNTALQGLFLEPNSSKAIGLLKSQFSKFLSDVDACVLPTSGVSIGAVFDKYFRKRAPFGDGKKKSEFPDAFAIEALEGWCIENDERIYVVSGDHGFKEHCKCSDRLIALNKLAEFVDIIVSYDDVLIPWLRKLLLNNEKQIGCVLATTFLEQGFWIDDEDGDVSDVDVNEVEVNDMLILEADECSAVVHAEVTTHFCADVNYGDIDTAVYDSEDKVLIPWRTIEKTVARDVEYTATVHVSFNQEKPDNFIINRVQIEPEQDYGFPIRIDDENER